MNSGNIAIFASGSGSNALKIIERLESDTSWQVALIVTNKAEAGVIQHARKYQIPCVTYLRSQFADEPQLVLQALKKHNIEFIVLAGFLVKIPDLLVGAYPNKIINIHPALLPEFGGKGMYGDHVHRAVLDARRDLSGITIHYVNNHYDEGQIIFQASTPVDASDSVESLRKKIQALEHRWFPEVLVSLLHEKRIPQQNEN